MVPSGERDFPAAFIPVSITFCMQEELEEQLHCEMLQWPWSLGLVSNLSYPMLIFESYHT